jgi:predicted phosphate transport protein (TIGR00153 family)
MAKVSAYFSNVFGHSPFRDLQNHAALCVEAAKELRVLMPAANEARWDDVEQSYNRLSDLENQADLQKRNIRSNLPRGFFLPVARADLLDLLGRQDGIANTARDVAGLVLGRRMQFPTALQPAILELVNGSIDTCEQVKGVVDMLDELIESGFKGMGARRVIGMIEQVEAAERKTDEIVVLIRAGLFAVENELPAVHVMFLYRVLDLIAELADVAERVAHRVQMMLAR